MRIALMLAVVLVAPIASAQPGGPADPAAPSTPAPAPGPAPAPAPAPGPAAAPDGQTQQPVAPPADVAPADAPAPKPDPAYGAPADHTVQNAGDTMTPGIRRGRDIVVRYTPSRSRKNITTLSVIAGAGVAFGAAGVFFHLDSRSSSDEVAAKIYTGRPWTADRQDAYDNARRSATVAGVMYGIGGALLLTTAIMYIVTEPEQEEMVVTPGARPTAALIAPTPGGALVGGTWSF